MLSDLTGVNSDGKQAADNKSYASFAQLNYEIAPSVRLTGGVRYTQDSRDMTWYDRDASAKTGNFVLEIYPLTKSQTEADKNLRLGFAIDNFEEKIIIN